MEASVNGLVPRCGGPSSKRIRVRVDISNVAGAAQFSLAADDKASIPHVKPADEIELPFPTPQTIIEFRLQGKAGKQLDFDTSDPVWIQANACPRSQCNVGTEVCILECTENRLMLLDQNSQPAVLYYRLNFVDAQGKPDHWDPIIRNGGGGP